MRFPKNELELVTAEEYKRLYAEFAESMKGAQKHFWPFFAGALAEVADLDTRHVRPV